MRALQHTRRRIPAFVLLAGIVHAQPAAVVPTSTVAEARAETRRAEAELDAHYLSIGDRLKLPRADQDRWFDDQKALLQRVFDARLRQCRAEVAGNPNADEARCAAGSLDPKALEGDLRLLDATRNAVQAPPPATPAPPALSIADIELPPGVAGVVYRAVSLKAQGGAPPYVWSSANLPPGLRLTPDGTLDGTPAAGTLETFDVLLRDSRGTQARRTLRLPVTPAGVSAVVSPEPVTEARMAALRAESALRRHDLLPTGLVRLAPRDLERWFEEHKRLLTTAYTARARQWSLIADQLGQLEKSVRETAGDRARETQLAQVIDAAAKDRQEQRRHLQDRLATASTAESTVLQAEIKALDELMTVDRSVVAVAASPGEAVRVAAMFGNAVRSARTFSQSQTDALEEELTLLRKLQNALVGQQTSNSNRVRIADNLSLPAGVQGQAYSVQLAALDGQPPYTWRAATLPSGLTIQGDRIVGQPTGYGDWNVILAVTDARRESSNKSLPLHIVPARLVISDVTLPTARQGRPIADTTLTATGGVPPYTWSSTRLAAGLTLSRDGKLSGTPRESNPQHDFVAAVRDSRGTESNVTLHLPIGSALPPQVATPNPLPVAQVGIPYSHQLTATGGAGNYTWFFKTKPAWADISSQGLVTGVPDKDGADVMTVYVRDGSGESSDSVALGISTTLNLKITANPTLPRGEVGAKYLDLALQATVPNLKWTKTGTLPKGMTLSAAGVLSGTPEEKGEFPFFVSATLPGAGPLTATLAVHLWIATPTETWRGDTPDDLVNLVIRDVGQNTWHAVLTVSHKGDGSTKSFEQGGRYDGRSFLSDGGTVFFELTRSSGVILSNLNDRMLSSQPAGVNARVRRVK